MLTFFGGVEDFGRAADVMSRALRQEGSMDEQISEVGWIGR